MRTVSTITTTIQDTIVSLHIKGDMRAAFKAADAHGVELTSIACVCPGGGVSKCYASTTSQHLPKVHAWFGEDAELIDDYGYPDGTLLFFS